MIPIEIKFVDKVISGLRKEIADRYEVQKNKLIKRRDEDLTKKEEIDYYNVLLGLGEEIVVAHSTKLADFQKDFEKIIDGERMKSKEMKDFRKLLIDDLGYADWRSEFYPKYFYKIGINTCVYCNALLTVVVKEEVQPPATQVIYKARFQLDHFLAKSRYPALSISLFNLYPVCANCNLSKGIRSSPFNLYTSNPSKSDYTFVLEDDSQYKFLRSRNLDDIKIKLEEPDVSGDFKSHEELFAIKGIYETQKDLAAELILKAVSYTETYKEALKQSVPGLFKDGPISKRLILGNYPEEKDTHLRPMAKFTRDIALQIGLLKKDDL